MASVRLSFSSWTPTAATAHKQNCKATLLSKTSLNFIPSASFLPSDRLIFRPSLSSPVISRNSTFSFVTKSSESEATVVEAEPESEPAQAVETLIEVPKREEIFAVVMVGSRQYIVHPGRFIYTQRLKGANVNDKIILNKVLLVGTKTSTYIGKPVVPNAVVHAVVEEQLLDRKVIVFKYKKKKNYRRNIGHRQPITRIRITGITGYQDSPAVTLET
ncbi:50S ribosomal protein L21, chloroplastic isoform X1 [Macadamia integrifolia]|uniref:50S ribosomal protein L21, chloroplastic isoform X1 n=1 Tax=Macadamia integrifolia TaxID=60698 RepID=UPI001C4F05D4|nr:50S ribosomal protein L21, chloroplastic isoform X1 [Macadamia integrifolia]